MNFVQSNVTAASTSGLQTCAFTGLVTAGNLLVCCIGVINPSVTLTVSDSLNGTWGTAAINSNTFGTSQIWVFPNTAGGSCTVSVACNPARGIGLTILEFAGATILPYSTAVDQTAKQSGSGGTTPGTSSSPPTTVSTEAVISCFVSTISHTWTVSGGGTLLTPASSYQAAAYYITGTTGAQSQNFTTDSATAYDATLITIYPVNVGTAAVAWTPLPDTIYGTWWASNSPWNAQIPASAFANPMSNSSAVITAYKAAAGSAFNVQSTTFTAGLIVAPAGTAGMNWNFTYNGSHTFLGIPATGTVATQLVNAEAWFASNSDTDRSLNLYSLDTGLMYDLYPDTNTTNGNGPIFITTASVRPLSGSGWWNQANFTTASSGTASGATQVGGSVKPNEWTAGVIPHALHGAWPSGSSPWNLSGGNPNSPDASEAFIYPARGSDSTFGSTASMLPEGARLQLDPSLSDAYLTGTVGVPAAMLPVCHAMQQYGWYNMDIDGTFPAQIKFLSTNPNSSPPFIGSYPGAASLPLALMDHVNWIHGPYLVGAGAAGMGVTVTNATGGCAYTTNYGSPDGLVHVGDIMTVYPAYQYGSVGPGTGGLQGFSPVNPMSAPAWWQGVSYRVLSVGSGTFVLGAMAGGAITSTAGTMAVYFTTNAPLMEIATAVANGWMS